MIKLNAKFKFKDWIAEIVELGYSTEVYNRPTEAPVTYIDADFVLRLIGQLTGDGIFCLNRNGKANPTKTDKLKTKFNKTVKGIESMLRFTVFQPKGKKNQLRVKNKNNKLLDSTKQNSLGCSKKTFGDVTTNHFYTWYEDKIEFESIVRDTVKLAKFMQEGCKKSVKDKNAEKARKSFKKLRDLMKSLEKKKCLGNRGKVISSYFDFNDFEF